MLINIYFDHNPNYIQCGPKRCIHFIIAIISYQINPGICFPGKSYLEFHSIISQLQ